MKVIDDFLTKVGTDKVLQETFSAKICSIIMIVSLLQDGIYTYQAIIGSAIIGTIVTIVLAMLKEIFDEKFDLFDIVASLIGCLFIWLAIGVGFLFDYLSR